jgi:GDP-L-fucose synthase
VAPALICRIVGAKARGDGEVEIWGTGTPLREFLHVDDLAEACLLLMQRYSGEQIINVGSGEEVSIAQLAQLIADIVGYQGRFVFDASKPDGTPRKILESSRMELLGFSRRINLKEGLRHVYIKFQSSPYA